MEQLIIHPLEPIYDSSSRVLILGTMPSPKSRALGFYYGNPQNRFWQVLSILYDEPLPATNPERQAFVLRHHIALWDVLASCIITGASDSSIRQPVANDLSGILGTADIRAIFCTGKKAAALYQKYCYPQTGIQAVCLPSPSPANCACPLETLVEQYRVLCSYT